jgi:hypothetical protein
MMLGAAELADADAFLLDAEYTQAWRVFWSETPESRATRTALQQALTDHPVAIGGHRS